MPFNGTPPTAAERRKVANDIASHLNMMSKSSSIDGSHQPSLQPQPNSVSTNMTPNTRPSEYNGQGPPSSSSSSSSQQLTPSNGFGNGMASSSTPSTPGVGGGDGQQLRTVYIGNLDPNISEDLLYALFSQMGQITSCKIIVEPGNDPYAFLEFLDHNSANMAVTTMNKRSCMGRELKVNWATSPNATGSKPDTSKHYHIFVGDLSPEVDTQQLRDAFSPFGEISDCRVVRDPQTLKSKGYGFVSFVKKNDAETAIQTMNGQWLGSRNIRTNWATRKPSQGINGRFGGGSLTMNGSGVDLMSQPTSHLTKSHHMNNHTNNGTHHTNHHHHHGQSVGPLTFEEVYNQSSPTNCTVYCGGILSGLSEELVKETFTPFGHILEVRVFKDKGYAFIKFASKEAAASAIVHLHNTEINQQIVKCSWGKESGDPSNQAAAVAQAAALAGLMAHGHHLGMSSYGLTPSNNPYAQYGQHQGMPGYWYQGYPGIQGQAFIQSAAAAHQAAAYSNAHTYGAHQFYPPQPQGASPGGPSPSPATAAPPSAQAQMMAHHQAHQLQLAWHQQLAAHVNGQTTVHGMGGGPNVQGANSVTQSGNGVNGANSGPPSHPHQQMMSPQQQQQMLASGYYPGQ